MSIAVSKLVWAYGPQNKKTRMLLLAIAEHADDNGYSYPGERLLARETVQSERTVNRQIQQLAMQDWVAVKPRSAGVVTRGGQYQLRGTAYQINLAKLRGELPTRQGQQAVAGATRSCADGERIQNSGRAPSTGVDGERMEALAVRPAPVENVSRDDKAGDSKRQNEHSETTKRALRDDKMGAPLLNHHEPSLNHHRNTNQHLPLPPGVECAKTSNGKSAHQGQEQKATASANATAATSALEAAMASTESLSEASLSLGPGFSVGGRVIPFRSSRSVERDRASLDGVEAALFDETMRVLGECGIAPKSSTRTQRNAIAEALQLYAERHGVSIAEAGEIAVRTWDKYLEAYSAKLLWRVVGVKEFFRQGYWLENGHPWDWNHAALAEMKQRSSAGIGMQRVASARREIEKHDDMRAQWERERAEDVANGVARGGIGMYRG